MDGNRKDVTYRNPLPSCPEKKKRQEGDKIISSYDELCEVFKFCDGDNVREICYDCVIIKKDCGCIPVQEMQPGKGWWHI